MRTETWIKKRGVRNEVKYVDTETWVHKSDTETQVQNLVHRNAGAELWVQVKEFKNVGRETWEKTGGIKNGYRNAWSETGVQIRTYIQIRGYRKVGRKRRAQNTG